MSKKIFIITGESSGDKIASLIIKKLKEKNLDIQILAIGGENIKLEKIDCIFDIKDIAYMGFIDVLKNKGFDNISSYQSFANKAKSSDSPLGTPCSN